MKAVTKTKTHIPSKAIESSKCNTDLKDIQEITGQLSWSSFWLNWLAIIEYRIVKHINEQPIMKTNQCTFCKGMSCLTKLLRFFESVKNQVPKG